MWFGLCLLAAPACAGAQPRPAGKPPSPPQPANVYTPPSQPVADLITRARQARSRKAFFAAAHFYRAAAARLAGDAAANLEFKAHLMYTAAGRIPEALTALNGFTVLTSRPYAKVYGVHQMRKLSRKIVRLSAVRSLYVKTGKGSPLAGMLSMRLARSLLASGKTAQARKVLAESRAGRAAVQTALNQGNVAKSRTLGCLFCRTGRYRRVCLAVLMGVLLAAEVFGPPGAGRPLNVMVADMNARGGPAGAVDRLAFGGRVQAVIGPVNPVSARAAAARAQKLGVPLIALTPDKTVAGTGGSIFQFLPQNDRRAQALTRAVTRILGVRPRIAIMAPSTSAGRKMAANFAAHVSAARGRVVAQIFYARSATHFGAEIAKLKRARAQALLAAMPARTLELLAPQLAFAGMWPRKALPPGFRPARRRRRTRPSLVVGATADGLSPARLKRSRRYFDGIFVAPGFFADPNDRNWGSFVTDYRRAYGQLPNIVAAYAYRAALRVRQVLDSGVYTRARLVKGLTALRLTPPAKGPLFDKVGRLHRAPAVYRVVRGQLSSVP